jgi:hypothetical protein
MGGALGAGWITGSSLPARGSEFGGRQVDRRLSFGFRCDKEMKPNPFGFNLNFDEFFGRRGIACRVAADGVSTQEIVFRDGDWWDNGSPPFGGERLPND